MRIKKKCGYTFPMNYSGSCLIANERLQFPKEEPELHVLSNLACIIQLNNCEGQTYSNWKKVKVFYFLK